MLKNQNGENEKLIFFRRNNDAQRKTDLSKTAIWKSRHRHLGISIGIGIGIQI